MEAEIGIGMSLGVVGDFGEPRAGNHDAGGSCRAFVEGIEAGNVLGVRDGEVVGVDDEELGIGGIAQALGDCLGLRV